MSLCRHIADCAARTRAAGSAIVRARLESTIEWPAGMPTDGMQGGVDFAGDRFLLDAGAEGMLVADGRLLYERKDESRWIRRQLPPGRHSMFDPRGQLELIATGCRAARATEPGCYVLDYVPAAVAGCFVPDLAPGWTVFTGTTIVDTSGRVTTVSVRLADGSGDDCMETILSLSDFGAPVRVEPPPDNQVVDYQEHLREVLGEEVLRGFLDEDSG